MNHKQFTGLLSSVRNPGSLSTTVSSLTNAVLSAAVLYAVVKGLDANAVTTQVQGIINLIATAIPAALVVWHSMQAIFAAATKLWYYLAAKPVAIAGSNTSAPVAPPSVG